jgi:hypothetical protein
MTTRLLKVAPNCKIGFKTWVLTTNPIELWRMPSLLTIPLLSIQGQLSTRVVWGNSMPCRMRGALITRWEEVVPQNSPRYISPTLLRFPRKSNPEVSQTQPRASLTTSTLEMFNPKPSWARQLKEKSWLMHSLHKLPWKVSIRGKSRSFRRVQWIRKCYRKGISPWWVLMAG